MAAISNGQSLEKLAQTADKIADVTSEDIHIASVQIKDSHNNIESLTEIMQCCLKISKKLDTLIDIFKDGYASVSPVHGCNYSTSRNGQRYFALRDRGHQKSLLNIKIRKGISCAISIKNMETSRQVSNFEYR